MSGGFAVERPQLEDNAVTASSKRGLYDKYEINRTDGRSEQGEQHDGCNYFVLDLDHDPHALPALAAYAKSCAKTHPQLAKDLRDIVENNA